MSTLPDQDRVCGDDDEGALLPEWVNVWGLAACGLATAGLLAASVVVVRLLTIVLAVGGLAVALAGIPASRDGRQTKDRGWLSAGAGFSGVLLAAAVFTPGL